MIPALRLLCHLRTLLLSTATLLCIDLIALVQIWVNIFVKDVSKDMKHGIAACDSEEKLVDDDILVADYNSDDEKASGDVIGGSENDEDSEKEPYVTKVFYSSTKTMIKKESICLHTIEMYRFEGGGCSCYESEFVRSI